MRRVNDKNAVRVVAIQDHRYDGILRKAGDEYDAEERYVATLRTVGFVQIAEKPKAAEYKRRDMRVEK